MTSITITRLTDDTAEISNERGHKATYRVYSDGSRVYLSGARWLMDAARNDLGSRRVSTGLREAMETGSAMVEVA